MATPKKPPEPRLLGKRAEIADSPEKAVLDRVPNPHADTHYVARFTAPEFTSLCPVTGQPDFAHLVIDYVPDQHLIESKSLKLFLGAFRNHGAFHEDCTLGIAKRIIATIAPKWLRIGGYWYPRGGMPIDVFFQTGTPPKGLWLPTQDVAPYRGRGYDPWHRTARRFARGRWRWASMRWDSRRPNYPMRRKPASRDFWPRDITATWAGWRT